MSLLETKVVIANQKTILENQALILKGQEEIKKNQATLNVIVRNQEEILAAQRHCMYREALEEHLKTCESIGVTKEKLATRH
jgi:DNA-binding transcriptional regulator YhcF (GntR family)